MSKFIRFQLLLIFLLSSFFSSANKNDSIIKTIVKEADTIESSRFRLKYLSLKLNNAITQYNYQLTEKIDSLITHDVDYGKNAFDLSSIFYRKIYSYNQVNDTVEVKKNYLELLNLYEITDDGIEKLYAGAYIPTFHAIYGQIDSVKYYLDILLKKAEQIDTTGLSETYMTYYYIIMSDIYAGYYSYYQKLNILDKATDNIIKSYKYNLLNNDTNSILYDYEKIGMILYRTNRYDEAKYYFKKRLNLALEKGSYNRHYTGALTGMGAIYIKEEKYDSAQIVFSNALEAYKQLKNTYNYDPSAVAGALMNMGVVYKKNKKYREALDYYNQALDLASQYNFPNSFYTTVLSKINLSNLFYELGDYDKAIEYSLSAINEQDPKYKRFNILAFENLSLIYKNKKDYKKAYEYYVKYTNYKDSINSEDIDTKIASLELSLENERIKNKNELLEKENEVSEIKSKQQKRVNILTFIFAFIILIAVFIILLINIKKRRAEKKLFLQTEESNKNEILSLIKSQEMQSMNSYMNGQEEERKRIASDLHDHLGSLFSTVKLYFSSLQSKFTESDESTKKTFKTVITLVDQAVDQVRSVSHNLSKDVVVQFGLIKAIKDIELAVNSSKKMKMKVIDNNFRYKFDKDAEMQLYKSLQEMITNSIRHSRAENIIVQFTSTESKEANIIVEDDGIGIDRRKVKNGMGMKNIHDRLNDIGAEYNIDSSPESGTTIIVNIKKQ